MIRLLVTALSSLVLASGAASAETLAVIHGKVATAGPQGVIEDGTVVVENGMIRAVGAGLPAPAGARVIDARGRWVTPGVFDPLSQLGLTELVMVGNDAAAPKAPFSAAFDVQYGINPDNTALSIARSGGITRSAVFPGWLGGAAGMFNGWGALVDLGADQKPVFVPRAFLYLQLGELGMRVAGGARGAAWVTLEEALRQAADPARRSGGDERDRFLGRLDNDAVAAVVQGKAPLAVQVERASDIRQALGLKARFPALRLILVGASEGWRLADDIARARVPVILNPFAALPRRFELMASTRENAARLHAAGVAVALTPGEAADTTVTFNAKTILQGAGTAVAYGLPWDAALRAVTIEPARMFGVADHFGSLEKGKVADLVVWDGDPFELSTDPAAVIIGGETQSLVTRQTKLRDRYRYRSTVSTGAAPRG